MSNLESEVIEELTIELKDDVDFSAKILGVKVRNAIREVRQRRNYRATSMTEEEILDDLNCNYFHVIINVARYDYNTIGAEGQNYMSENGNTRTYVSRDKLFSEVQPFVKVL